MQINQIHASIPGAGEVPLLDGLAESEQPKVLTGQDEDLGGSKSATFGAMFVAPWIGSLSGTHNHDHPEMITTTVAGKKIQVYALSDDSDKSVNGSLAASQALHTESTVLIDGQSVSSSFLLGEDNGWPSTISMTGTVRISGQSIDITWTAKNTGSNSTPFSFGWAPIFSLPAGLEMR